MTDMVHKLIKLHIAAAFHTCAGDTFLEKPKSVKQKQKRDEEKKESLGDDDDI